MNERNIIFMNNMNKKEKYKKVLASILSVAILITSIHIPEIFGTNNISDTSSKEQNEITQI